jgi:NAD+ diphosphatase
MMLQDIAPHIYHNEIIFPEPAPEDNILVFSGNTVLGREQDGRFVLPRVRELALPPERLQYLFSVDGANYWLLMGGPLPQREGFALAETAGLRAMGPDETRFAFYKSQGNTAQFAADAFSTVLLASFPSYAPKMLVNPQRIRCAF